MAQIVLGIGTSHTPMLNAPPEDWPRFIERDTRRTNLLDVDGRLTTYEAQLKRAPADIDAQIAPERMQARHAAVEAAMSRLGDYLRDARLDALIVVGDDQDELYHPDNLPGFLVYYGEAIANVPLKPVPNPDWGWRASARWYEEKEPRDYPVYLLPAEPADPQALLQIRPGAPGGGRILSRQCPGRHHRLGRPQPFCGRRGARPRLHRDAAHEERRRDPGPAAREAEFRQLGNPQLDLRRRRRRTPVARMVALRARLPHPGRHRHRPGFCLLVVITSGMSWIDLSIYSRPRVFQEPFFKITEVVGIQSVLWAFIFGPFFYWKKGARAETMLMVLAAAPLLQVSQTGAKFSMSLSEIPYLSGVVWAIFAALAPILLVMHYQRKGWVEVT